MDERERLRRLGDDPLHDDTLDEPTIVDRIPDAGAEFDDPIALGDRLPLGSAARPGYGGAYVDPIAGETGTDPGTETGTMGGATYGDRLGGETPMLPPADTQEAPLPPEATGGAVGALGGMVAGAIVGGPPGAVVGGIVGAVGGAIVGGAAASEHDDGPAGDLDEPVTPVDEPSDPRLR